MSARRLVVPPEVTAPAAISVLEQLIIQGVVGGQIKAGGVADPYDATGREFLGPVRVVAVAA
jgi:hypothetical protein